MNNSLKLEQLEAIQKKEIKVSLACSVPELKESCALTHEMYLSKEYTDDNPFGVRTDLWDMRKDTYRVVAKHGSEVVGTMRLIVEKKSPLPVNQSFGPILEPYHQDEVLFAELSSLGVKKGDFGNEILLKMFCFCFKLSTESLGVTHFVNVVNPRHKFFYKKIFLFKELSESKKTRSVNGAPGVAMVLKLSDFSFRLASSKMSEREKYFYHFFKNEKKLKYFDVQESLKEHDSFCDNPKRQNFILDMIQRINTDKLKGSDIKNKKLPLMIDVPKITYLTSA